MCSELKTRRGPRSAVRGPRFPQINQFAVPAPIFSSAASAISFGIAAKKMRKTPTVSMCEKAVENLRISLEKGVQNAVDFLRVSGGLAADKQLRNGGRFVDLKL
jgi:hypothetical protein